MSQKNKKKKTNKKKNKKKKKQTNKKKQKKKKKKIQQEAHEPQFVHLCLFVSVGVLLPSQPTGVMSSAVNLPNHTFTVQALSFKLLTSVVHILLPEIAHLYKTDMFSGVAAFEQTDNTTLTEGPMWNLVKIGQAISGRCFKITQFYTDK